MKNKKSNSHGAVSVFIAIILVPCIVFTCIFGDLSRVQLSMATVSSAGDLSLYSLMSHYDKDLKEFYGLVGSCQNINEFYSKSETYFKGMLAAEGVPEEGSQLFTEYWRQLREGGYQDFMRVELSGVNVTAAKNGSMGSNPALIEDGIVEFMKYRGPIQITTNLIDRFSDLDFEKEVTEANDNEEVVKKKQEYVKAQGDLLEQAFYNYLAIRAYEKAQEDTHYPSREMYQKQAEELNKIRDDLKGVTSIVTKYYFPGSEKIRSIVFPTFKASDYHYDKEDVGEKTVIDGTEYYCLTDSIKEKLTKELDTQLDDITKAADDFVSGYDEIGAPGGGTNEVVFCLKMQRMIDDKNIIDTLNKKGDAVMKTWAKLIAAAECQNKDGGDLSEEEKKELSDTADKISKVYDKYLSYNGSSDYMKKVKSYTQTSMDTVPKVKNRMYTFTSQLVGQNVTLDQFAEELDYDLELHRTNLEEQIKRLDTAIDGGTVSYNGKNHEVKALDKLTEKAQEFTTARTNWGTTAASKNTDYAKGEYTLYQGAENAANGGGNSSADDDGDEAAGERIAAQITPESVTELKQRLEHIRSDAQAALTALDNLTYGGGTIQNMSSGDALINAACTVVPETTSIQKSEAEDAARGYSGALIAPAEGDVYKAPDEDNSSNGNNPALSNNPPKLYEFLKNKFGNDEGNIENEIEDSKKKREGYAKKADDSKKNATGIDNDVLKNKGKNLEDVHSKPAVSAVTALGSVVSVAKNVMEGKGDELRDQIYVCEYIMDMFSYSDFENEGRYRLALETNKKTTYKDFPYEDQKEAWTTEKANEVMRNQSLTNRPITNANNHAHLGEVEYVLYGNASIDENLKIAYENIFAIRELMNLVSGFANFYSSTDTKNTNAVAIKTVAATVASATAGIVPIPVTKCALILALSTLESAKDMERLKKGGRVELYKKSYKDWAFDVNNLINDAADSASDSNQNSKEESGMYYSDYMYIFLLLGLTNDKTYSSMLLRVGDLIQANMRKAGDENFDLTKTQTYFNLTGTVRVKPLMMSLPIVDTVDGASEMREKTDWCTYKVNMIRGYS